MTATGLSLSDRNLLLQIERNSTRRFEPKGATQLVERGLVDRSSGSCVLTEAGRLAVNKLVAEEWRANMCALSPTKRAAPPARNSGSMSGSPTR